MATRVEDRLARGTEALSVWRYARERVRAFLNTPSNALLRRLLFDQGVRHWKGYLFAFAMMGLIAATTALSAWIIGRVVDQVFVGTDGKQYAQVYLATDPQERKTLSTAVLLDKRRFVEVR